MKSPVVEETKMKVDLIAETRALLAKVTPWPWTTKPGAFWICDVGNTGCGVWSTAYPPEGEPFPFAEQEADAALLARAPELLSTLCDQNDALREALRNLGWHSQNGIDVCWCHVKSDGYAKHTEQCAAARLALVDSPQNTEEAKANE